jgi:hypothetical protein
VNVDFETELRDALGARASRVPPGALDRLRRVDYRPRASRLPRTVEVGALAGMATAGTVVSVAVLGGSSPAFAGWSATPTRATAAQTTDAGTSCQQRLSSMRALPGSSGAVSWQPVTTDVRGPFTLSIYQSGSDYATCLMGPSVSMVTESSGNGKSGSTEGGMLATGQGTVPPSRAGGWMQSSNLGTGTSGVEQISVAHLSATGEGAYTLVYGRIASDVTGVTLVRKDGQDVQATTGNGWFVAWWPKDVAISSTEVTTPTGTTTQPVHLSHRAPPAPGQCSAGASNGASTSTPTTGASTSTPRPGVSCAGGNTTSPAG